MRALLRNAVLGITCSATLACTVPGFAQTHTGRVRDTPDTIAPDTALASLHIVQLYDARDPAGGTRVPDNVSVSTSLLPILESMLRGSPTFRRQCLRIASATNLTVVLRTAADPLPGARARTRVTVDAAGRRHALVEVTTPHDHAELIAHELEHIIEQLDGIDLAARATLPATGVRRCADGAFETLRAIRAGRDVAEEMRRPTR